MSNKELKKLIRESKPLKPKEDLYEEGNMFNPTFRYGWEHTSGSYEKGKDYRFKNKQTEHNYSTSQQMGGSIERYEHIEGLTYPNPSKKTDKDIAHVHGISFIKEVIPRLIQKKIEDSIKSGKSAEKVRILDIGGGVGVYAEQLRKTFGDDVEVYTTGLRKKPVKQFRRLADKINKAEPEMKDAMFWETSGPLLDGNISNKMHKNDLIKRSLLEFKDFPEFDLILDTAGELPYQTDYNRQGQLDGRAFLRDYLKAVVNKLRPGGVASISHIDFVLDNSRYVRDFNILTEWEVGEVLKALPVEFEIIDNGMEGKVKYHKVLRIKKLESGEIKDKKSK
ncbi:MAG: hypothetical protein WCW77_01635 [Patescibacteria group bacterium]|jgi:hypothetical protein